MNKLNIISRNFEGKIVYIGIDVHKKNYIVTCICDEGVVKRATLEALPEKLVEFVNKYFTGGKIMSAYEAGFSGFVLHRFLVKNGINNIVVHPAAIEVSARDRVKTDQRDSLKIATQLSSGRLKGIYVPSAKREAFRAVTRLRESVLEDRKRVGNQLKSLLYLQGLIAPNDKQKVTKKWVKKVMKYEVDKNIRYCIQVYGNQWLDLEKKIMEINEQLEKQAQEDKAMEIVYQSAPGIGKTNSRQLSNELGDMRHFKNEKGLFSFTGLTPSEYSSGEHKRQGHISRQGRALLRKTLTQAAWIAIKRDPSLGAIFERIAKNVGKKRAIVGIARRLIGRIRSCFITGCLYEVRTH